VADTFLLRVARDLRARDSASEVERVALNTLV